jgi:hypothetical protein
VSWSVADVPEAPPPAPGVVRLRVNSGQWLLEPAAGGNRTRARYSMVVDPGGQVPIWLANLLLTGTLPKVFRAVRGESEKSTHPQE